MKTHETAQTLGDRSHGPATERLEQIEPSSVKLVVAISSRALFDLDESHRIFVERGEAEYSRYQIAHEDVPLNPGVAFRMVKKLLALNSQAGKPRVAV